MDGKIRRMYILHTVITYMYVYVDHLTVCELSFIYVCTYINELPPLIATHR